MKKVINQNNIQKIGYVVATLIVILCITLFVGLINNPENVML